MATDTAITIHLEWNKTWMDSLVNYYKHFNKNDIQSCADMLIRRLWRLKYSFSKSSPRAYQDLYKRMIKGEGKILKDDLIKLITLICGDYRNVRAISEAAEPKMLTLWQRLVTDESVSLADAEEMLGHKLNIFSTGGWSPRYITDPMLIMASLIELQTRSYYRYNKPDTLFLSQWSRKEAAPVFIREDILEPKVSESLPETMKVENYHDNISRDISYLSGVASCNALTTASGTLTPTKINSISKKLATPEFSYNPSEYPVSRKALLILAFAKYYDYVPVNQLPDAAGFSRDIAKDFGKDLVSTDFSVMLPKYKGFTKTFSEQTRAHIISEKVNQLIAPSSGGWLDVSTFPLTWLCNDSLIYATAAFTSLFNPSDFERYASLRLESQSATSRKPHVDLWKDVTFPYILHYIKLLCACGMLEMAVDPTADSDDPTEGVRYVRMTPLGRYGFGFDKKYEEASQNRGEEFELDPDSLILTVLNPDSPYMMFLEQFGRRIGSNRFHITAKEFVKKAGSKDTVISWIDTFKRVICPEPEGVWQEMLEEVVRRTGVKKSAGSWYSIMQLDLEVPGLKEFILSDVEIKSNVLLAQRGFILVTNSFRDKFESILKSAGYLL